MPCAMVDAENGQLGITCGSSYQTRDCIVEALEAWWAAWDAAAPGARARLQITRENGPESSGRRTHCL
jgi:Rhodopirellula transposase DDE domain